MDKYAVFIDIDGTYTCGSPVPPEENVDAVVKARAAGHKVFINTGRSYGFIPKEVLASTEFDGIIAGDGSYIVFGGEVIKNDRMERDDLAVLAEYFLAAGKPCLFEGEEDILYVNMDKPDKTWLEVKSPDDFYTKYAGIPVTKLTVSGHLPEEGRELVEKYLHLIEFETYCEAVIKGNNKAGGIKEVLSRINIPAGRCIAMGDSRNDMDMVKYSGIGVAMGNACDELKAAADFVSLHAQKGGVAYAINKFLLAKKD